MSFACFWREGARRGMSGLEGKKIANVATSEAVMVEGVVDVFLQALFWRRQCT